MTCANHPDVAAVAFCRSCGKPLCQVCQRPAEGTIFCNEHVPITVSAPFMAGAGPAASAPMPGGPTPGAGMAGAGVAGESVPGATTAPPPPPPGAQPYSPYTSPTPYAPLGGDPSVSPGLAFLLGLIPGVGAIYNGQYAKGLVHIAVFGMTISLLSSGAAAGVEGVVIAFLIGWYFYMPFEAYHTAKKRLLGEPVDEFSSLMPMRVHSGGFPVGPLVLIALGVVFLLNSLNVIRLYELLRWWPIFLIVLGAYMLVVRLTHGRTARIGAEAVDEQ